MKMNNLFNFNCSCCSPTFHSLFAGTTQWSDWANNDQKWTPSKCGLENYALESNRQVYFSLIFP